MTQEAIVGVTANRLIDDDVHREWTRRRYIDALEAYADVTTVILPTFTDANGRRLPALARLDGLLLTGDESNMDCAVFRNVTEEGAADEEGSDKEGADYERDRRDRYRDRLSFAALRTALPLGMPILGICRGFQEMNVYFGGTLVSDLAAQPSMLSHSEDVALPRDRQYDAVHDITLTPSGLLNRLTGEKEIRVNSLHKQGLGRIGDGLVVEAVAPDGLVEALRVADTDIFQVGLQWHPEWHASSDRLSRSIFKAFGEACHGFSATRNL